MTPTKRLSIKLFSKNTSLGYKCWVIEGAQGTVYIEARTTTQARETPHCYSKL